MSLAKRHSNYHKLFRTNGLSEIRGAKNKKHIRFLKNQFKNGKTSIVYIMKGAAGIGKTATCYNVAQAVNCQDPDIEPGESCGKCDSCQDLIKQDNPDIILINGAVDGSIDDVRGVIEKINLTNPRYNKICIIIDEWHNLSKPALEALLGILEDAKMGGSSEDETKYMFLLPTTSLDRIPPALISRAQVLDFSPLTKPELVDYLASKCEFLELEYDEEALKLIFDATNGGVRDSLAILERIAYSFDFNITVEGTQEILNAGKSELAPKLFDAILELNMAKALNLVKTFNQNNGIEENDFNDLFELIDNYIDSEDCEFDENCLVDCLSTLIEGRDAFIRDSSIRSKDVLSVTLRKIIVSLKKSSVEETTKKTKAHPIDISPSKKLETESESKDTSDSKFESLSKEELKQLKKKTLSKLEDILDKANETFCELLFDCDPTLKVDNDSLILLLEEPEDEDEYSYLKTGFSKSFMKKTLKSLNIDGHMFI